MLAAAVAEMRRQTRPHAIGEHRSTVLLPLTTPDDDLMAVEIEVVPAEKPVLITAVDVAAADGYAAGR